MSGSVQCLPDCDDGRLLFSNSSDPFFLSCVVYECRRAKLSHNHNRHLAIGDGKVSNPNFKSESLLFMAHENLPLHTSTYDFISFCTFADYLVFWASIWNWYDPLLTPLIKSNLFIYYAKSFAGIRYSVPVFEMQLGAEKDSFTKYVI